MLTDTSQLTDEELLVLLKQGNRFAFEILYRKYWPKLYNHAYKRIKCHETTEEILQDLFVSLWNKRQELNINSSFASYLFTALKYKLINHIRSEVTKNKYLLTAKHFLPVSQNTVEEKVLYNELHIAIEKEINNLPDNCKKVFTLSRKENLTLKEIAGTLNLSINTVEKQLSRALKILRANLKDYLTTLTILFSSFF